MTDWKAVAAGRGLGIPDTDLDRIVPVLEALEATFRPLVENIPFDVEPAVTFSCPAGDES